MRGETRSKLDFPCTCEVKESRDELVDCGSAPLCPSSQTSNRVNEDKREQQVARMELQALTNSQQEDRSRPVSSKTWMII